MVVPSARLVARAVLIVTFDEADLAGGLPAAGGRGCGLYDQSASCVHGAPPSWIPASWSRVARPGLRAPSRLLISKVAESFVNGIDVVSAVSASSPELWRYDAVSDPALDGAEAHAKLLGELSAGQ